MAFRFVRLLSFISFLILEFLPAVLVKLHASVGPIMCRRGARNEEETQGEEWNKWERVKEAGKREIRRAKA